MVDINQEIERLVAEMREVGKQAAPCKGGNYNNLLRYNELQERILSKFLEAFDAGGRLEMPTLTNGGKIRAMSDEELATVIVKAYNGGDPSFLWCDRKGDCAGEDEEDLVCTDERLLACVVRWLGSPAKEGT